VKFRYFDEEGRRHFSPLAIVGMVAGGIVVGAGLAFVFGWVVMLLWNWLMPAIFRLPSIGFWQAWGLVLLSAIFFKGGGSGAGRGRRGHGHGKNPEWRRQMRDRFGRPEDGSQDAEKKPD
jgi:hypothetical protein